MSATSTRPQVLVIGGGIIGLSTAIALQDHPVSPYNVTIIAKDLPATDPLFYSATFSLSAPASYASAWAGAHHVSDAKNSRQLGMDKTTFEVFRQMKYLPGFGDSSGSKQKAIVEVHQVEYLENFHDQIEYSLAWYPEYQRLPPSSLPPDVAFGCTFRTFDINVPQYLPPLLDLFTSLGGRIICATIKSISEAIDIFSQKSESKMKPDAMVISPGLGAIELLGDTSVHPVRGQTVLVRAPWCTTTSMQDTLRTESSDGAEVLSLPEWSGISRVNTQGFRDMYILPRGDGTFILGGTRLPNDWDDAPRQETTDGIIQRALQFMPALSMSSSEGNGAQEVDLIGVNVGLRPARSKGVRLEQGESVDGVPTVYSYGYGGFGYQCSWGAAFIARDLIDDILKRPRAPFNSSLASLWRRSEHHK